MKSLIVLLFASALFSGTAFAPHDIRGYGLSVETVCKNGLLIDVVTGKVMSNEIRVEQAHCVNYSSWDHRSCTHQPIKCVKDSK